MLTRLSNSASSRRCRIIASVMSATWNSSRQIRRKRRAMLAPSCSSGSLVPFSSASSRCTSRMNSWKCSRVFLCSGSAREEAVHQEALAAPDAAPEVDAARDRRARDQLGERVRAPRLVVGPLALAALERIERAQLRGVGLVAAFGERLLVELADAHSAARSSAPACRPPARLPWSPPTGSGARGRCGRCPRPRP